jgi:tRNA (adenine37-N6)-methyltransferase
MTPLDSNSTIHDQASGRVVPRDREASGTIESEGFMYHVTKASRGARRDEMSAGDFRWADSATPSRAASSARGEAGVTFSLGAIGVVHSPFHGGCPNPKHFGHSSVGTVEVFPEFLPGLKGIEAVRDLWLLAYCRPGSSDTDGPAAAGQAPREGFGARAACGPGALMLTLVRIVGAQGGLLKVEGLDLDDGTPLLDIKPYLAHRDNPRESCTRESCAHSSQHQQRRRR